MHAAFNGFTPLSRGIDPVVKWKLHGIIATVIAVGLVLLSRELRRPVANALKDTSSTAVAEAAA